MSISDNYLGREVVVKTVQRRLGGAKCPGRNGVITRIHPFEVPELLFFVSLKATKRGKARIETFWLSDLEFLDSDNDNSSIKEN